MRDDKIYQMHEANVRRTLLLLSQLEFVQTKIQAYEEVMSSTKSRILAIFKPEWARRVVDNRQKELLAERKRLFEEASQKAAVAMPRLVRANG